MPQDVTTVASDLLTATVCAIDSAMAMTVDCWVLEVHVTRLDVCSVHEA
jgi:hypothetical protein